MLKVFGIYDDCNSDYDLDYESDENSEKEYEILSDYVKILSSPVKLKNTNKTIKNSETKEYDITSDYDKIPSPIKFKNTNKTIKTIYHLADIHIRISANRNKEYVDVFERLYKNINENNEDSLIVICGDILHEKCTFSDISLKTVFNFLENLVNITDVIVIMGNHDGYTLRGNRRDALLHILERVTGKHDLYYLQKSGIYEYENLVFGVSSLYDNIFVSSDHIKSNKIKIALYHGSVSGSVLQNNFPLENYDKKSKKFSGYDYVMLGDIHKHQYLDKKKKMAYSSSLIQQNHGESLLDHGYIKWNLVNKTSKFIRLHNDYGFITMSIEDNKIVDIPHKLPKIVRLRLRYKNTGKTTCLELLTELFKKTNTKYERIEWHEVYNKNNCKGEFIKNLEANICKVEYQNKLIKDYCKKKLDINDSDINKIIDLNNKMNDINKPINNIKGIKWKLLNLKFSNMFSYGENNEIDFSTLNGLVGIIGPNHYGKSSILDVILFCLFGNCSKSKRIKDVMNINKRWFSCELIFKINNTEYKIVKNNRKGKTKFMIDTYFYKKNKNEFESLPRSKISTYVGSYEDFIMTHISLQKSNNFTDLTPSKKIDYLIKLSGIDIFDSLLKEIKKKLKTQTILHKKLKDIYGQNNDANIDKQINDYTKQKEQLCDIVNNKKKEVSVIYNDINKLYSQKCKIDDNINIDQLINELEEFKSDKNKHDINLSKLINEVDIFNNKYSKDKIQRIHDKHIFFISNNKKTICDINIKINSLIESKKNIINIKNTKLLQIKKKRLNAKLKRLQDNISKKQLELKKLIEIDISKKSEKNTIKKYNRLDELLNELNIKQEEFELILLKKSEADEIMDILANFEYDNNCKCCINNPFTIKANAIKDNYNTIKKEYDDLNNIVVDLNNKIKKLKIYNSKYKKLEQNKIYNQEIIRKKNIINQDIKILKQNTRITRMELKKVTTDLKIVNQNKIIINDNKIIDGKINSLQDKLKILNEFVDNEYNDMIESQDKINITEKEILNIKCKIIKLDLYISNCKILIDGYENNKVIDNKIDILNNTKNILLDKIYNHEVDKTEVTLKMHDLNKTKKDNKVILQQIKDYEDDINIYNKYISIVNRQGLPYDLISNLINRLEYKTNSLLCNITNFTVKIEKDTNGSCIHICKQYDEQQINILNCSGYEQFIVNLALRLSIIEISNLSSANFTAIDEGFSCMDNTNRQNIGILFNKIRNTFDFILIVSHLDELKSNCDDYINIIKQKPNDPSFVNYV